MKIHMAYNFGEEKFVERQEVSGLPYETTIVLPIGGKVIARTSDKWISPRRTDGYVLNPNSHKKRLFFRKPEIDQTRYEIYFVDTESWVDGLWGGSVDCPNKFLSEIQFEKIFVNVDFKFKVEDLRSFVEGLISDKLPQYSRDYFSDKIRDYLSIFIQDIVSKNIDNLGLEKIDRNKTLICQDIEKEIHEKCLGEKGIRIQITKLSVKEQEKYQKVREDLEFRKQAIKNMED